MALSLEDWGAKQDLRQTEKKLPFLSADQLYFVIVVGDDDDGKFARKLFSREYAVVSNHHHL